MTSDLRHALRSLRKQPAFTAVAVLTLALGIGATTAIFSVVEGVLLRPLPYPDSDRLVSVRHALPGLGLADAGQSGGTYQHYREHNRAFAEMGLYFESFFNLTGDGEPERIRVALITPSVLTVLRATPLLGRLLALEDDAASAEGGVMISHSLWVRRFGADADVIGRSIRVIGLAGERDPAPRTVIGVLPPGFAFPHPETQVWYSIRVAGVSRGNLRNLYLTGVARLRPGVSPAGAEADLRRLVPSLAEAYPDVTPERLLAAQLTPVVRPLKDVIVGDVGATLWIVLGGVGFVLLIACANVANLFLVRADHREREIALREALGARRGEVARHFLGESALIALAGGLLGLLMAYGGLRLLSVTGAGMIPRLHEVGLDGTALAFALGITLLCVLFFAGIPLLRRGRDLTSSLREVRGATPGPSRQRARRLLVTSQMALGLVLLIASALMVQSLRRLQQVDLGFNPEGVLTFQPALTFAQYPNYRAVAGLHVRLLERLRALPGVEAAEAVSDLPLTAGPTNGDVDFVVDGPDFEARGVGVLARYAYATPGYFAMMGIPLLGGRTFQPGDLGAAAPAVILSAGFARTLFRGDDPLGRRIRLAEWPDDPPFTVVGVVGDVAGERPGGTPTNTVYFPILGDPVSPPFLFIPRDASIVVRAAQSPLFLIPAVRAIVSQVDAELPIARVRTMEQVAADSMARNRFVMLLLSIAALASLFLGAVGLYGVISYVVGRRTHEIGVRIALGARSAQVRRMILRQGAAVALTGLAIGIPAALALTRFLGTLLFEVSPTDPVIFAGTSVLLLAVALLASYLPARRAASVEPLAALRYE